MFCTPGFASVEDRNTLTPMASQNDARMHRLTLTSLPQVQALLSDSWRNRRRDGLGVGIVGAASLSTTGEGLHKGQNQVGDG